MKRTDVLLLIVSGAAVIAGCGPGTREGRNGWYYAGSKQEDEKALGGFGPSENYPRRCPDDSLGGEGRVSLVASPAEVVERAPYRAMPVRVVNRTKEAVPFAACDSCLFIVEEAINREGQWQPLEPFPQSHCGNSYHRVFLGPGEYWEFIAPHRQGRFKTKLRFRLEPGGDRGIVEGGGALYSDEFEGSINPSAFVRERAD